MKTTNKNGETKMSEMKPWVFEHMKPINACLSAIDRANQYDNPQSAWDHWDRGDEMLWTIVRKKYDRPTLIRCVCDIAEHTLEIFEKKYPDDKRPRQAIETARKVADNDTPKNRTAAYAAARAAYAADAADAERKWQVDCVRKRFPVSPFLTGMK